MIIEQKKNDSRIEALPWDGTGEGMSKLCNKFELVAASHDKNKIVFNLRNALGEIGDIVKGDWMTQNLVTKEFKVMTSEELERLLR